MGLLDQTITFNLSFAGAAKIAGGGITLGGIIWYGIKSGFFLKCLAGSFVWANKKYAKISIKKSLDKAMESDELAQMGIHNRKIKLEFIEDLKLTEFEDGESIIVSLDSTKNNPKNVALATIQAVSKNLFPQSAITLSRDIEKSVTYALAKKAFDSNKLVAASKYFDREILPLEYKSNPTFEKIMGSIEDMDKMGLLSRMLVRQYFEVNQKKFETFKYSEIQKETEEFFEFIHKLATREEHAEVPLKFYKNFIKVKVILVSSSKQAKVGPQGVVDRLNNEKEAEHIYLIFPAINKMMVDRNHIPTWKLYKEILEKIRAGGSKFILCAEPKEFFVLGTNDQKFKVSVVFLERNG